VNIFDIRPSKQQDLQWYQVEIPLNSVLKGHNHDVSETEQNSEKLFEAASWIFDNFPRRYLFWNAIKAAMT
jgi:hypothetical protein